MQEESIITLIVFLAGQTIAIWKKLSRIEQKIDIIQKHNDEQDEKISRLMKVVADKVAGAARELIA